MSSSSEPLLAAKYDDATGDTCGNCRLSVESRLLIASMSPSRVTMNFWGAVNKQDWMDIVIKRMMKHAWMFKQLRLMMVPLNDNSVVGLALNTDTEKKWRTAVRLSCWGFCIYYILNNNFSDMILSHNWNRNYQYVFRYVTRKSLCTCLRDIIKSEWITSNCSFKLSLKPLLYLGERENY